MAKLGRVSDAARLRARRWDVIVLGSGLSGLVAAARLSAANHSVLVVEEDAARAQHPALREPFLLSGLRDEGVLYHILRNLNIPLIDRRRLQAERLAYQVVSPKWRVDVGAAKHMPAELEAWGLGGDEDDLPALIRILTEATDAERNAMLEAEVVRSGRRIGLRRGLGGSAYLRGLPVEAARLEGELKSFFDGQLSALSNLASSEVTGEARSRLMGLALHGGAGFGDGPPWLMGLLRRRIEALHGEFRTVAGDFALVSADGQPGIRVTESDELWLGRVMAVAASPAGLTQALDPESLPNFLSKPRNPCRRIAVHFRVDQDALPRGMGARLISLGEETSGETASGRVATLTAHACTEESGQVDLVARMRARTTDEFESVETELEARIRSLIPFSGERLKRLKQRRPLWDDDGWLEDPKPGAGWPVVMDVRASGRPPVYRLNRSGVASLGFEGDLLLGWRAGDLISQELD
ncbi:MAG: NAD(P)-binding protein [Myxococcota bacterium]|nr:hypothetical protein [Spirochaeta sp.]RPG11578.1 MAG: FAD-binding protein [Proteobacteria bacterium TMED72]